MTPSWPLRAHLWSRARALARARGQDAAFTRRFPQPENAGLTLAAPPDAAALGDELERLRGARREAEFKALIAGTTKAQGHHGNATTQRFTPPWIARWLAERGLAARAHGASVNCLDPACGGGQLLLALMDAGVPAQALHGVDIDPVAVDVARWSLWLRARRPGDEVATRGEPTLRVVDPPLGTLGATLGTYGLVIVNPPYMGARHLDPATRAALREQFAPYHGDLYTAFLERCLALTEPGGAVAFLCQQSFLFLKRDRALRRDLMRRAALREVLHLGPHAFPGIQGEKASVVAFTATLGGGEATPSVIDLRDLRSADAKRAAVGEPARRFDGGPAARRAQGGGSFAYWVAPAALRRLDRGPFLGDVLDVAGSSHKTADNARCVRCWWEVPADDIGPGRPFVRYAKGGAFRRWHGNLERVVDWSEQARRHYATHPTANLLPERYWYREGITWSDFGGLRFSARHLPAGCAFDMAGPAAFLPIQQHSSAPTSLWFWLGLLNTQCVCGLLNALNPTIHYQVGDLRALPIPDTFPVPAVERIAAVAQQAVDLTRELDRHATPTSPDYIGPRLWTVEGDLEERLAAATAWWAATWEALHGLRAEIEAAVRALYGIPGVGPADPVPTAPDWVRHARDHLRGQQDGRYARTPIPSGLKAELTKRSSPAIFPTPWHPSRLAS